MDPNQTLNDIATSFRSGEWEECQEHCENLLGWLTKGGFGLANFRRSDVIGYCRLTHHICQSEIERQQCIDLNATLMATSPRWREQVKKD
jgi:hypothetical protein